MENVKETHAFLSGIFYAFFQKLTFKKGYEANWTELFMLTECVPRDLPVYQIKDLLDELIKGMFYVQDIQKVQQEEEYVIEKRVRKGLIEYKVTFKSYSSKLN